MGPYNDPHRQRAFQSILTDIRASHQSRDGRYRNLASQLDSLASAIEGNDLKIKPLGKDICTPTADQLRKTIVHAFGGVEIFKAPMQVLTAEQQEHYFTTASSDSQIPCEKRPKERKAKDPVLQGSPSPQAMRHKISGGKATEQSDSLLDVSDSDAGISHPGGVERKVPTRIRLYLGSTNRAAAAASTMDCEASREIADSQNDDVSSDESDSGGSNKPRDVIDLSQRSSPQQGKNKDPKLPKPGGKRKAGSCLEVETQRSSKKRALVGDGRRSVADEDFNALVSVTKRPADTALNGQEERVAKKRTLLGTQTKLATDRELRLVGRKTKRKAETTHDDDKQVPNKKAARLDLEPQSCGTSLPTENDDSHVQSATKEGMAPGEKQHPNHRVAQEIAAQPQSVSESVAMAAGDAFPADENGDLRAAHGKQAAPTQAATATQQRTPDEIMRRAELGLGPVYPFNLRSIEDIELRVASMVSTIRTIASILNESSSLTDAPPSLMCDPDLNTERLFKCMFAADDAQWRDNANRFLSEGENTTEVLLCGFVGAALYDRVWSQPVPWKTAQDFESEWADALEIVHKLQLATGNKTPMEYFTYQASADRLKDDSKFDRERIQPLAREHAKSMFMALMPQLRHMNPRLRIKDSVRASLLESLTFLFANALKLRGRLEADPADYEYLWPHSGMKFEIWMHELRGYDGGDGVVERTMACLVPAIRRQDPERIVCKAQVFGS
ncbi:hypothetical protein CERZMDRAFT_86173 [Cercospora zeae-maydis SCOH1-5]|uniref:Uncharacterized protein n=1 Tax=Cercospora zeae-maydis SCOH1-5 TaxID=717836 RepID=A0A6A6FAQ4_9PEZI|nr:hypothetical protein CERZMDRAFT_86173 [Cercospora zeae-maydis SCOH1-5]